MSLGQLTGSETFVIAEAGVNHNGSLRRALEMVDAASDAGANAVKFQSFNSGALVSERAPKAAYQAAATGSDESQLEMLRKLELDEPAHFALRERALKRKLVFLSTPFDAGSLRFLAQDLGLGILKMASGELTNAPLLLQAARTGKPLIVSTGMSTLEEVRLALGTLAFGYLGANERPGEAAFGHAAASEAGRAALASRVALLHCTSQYPAPIEDSNLRALDTLREAFGLMVGYSDHTPGISVSLAAVARGARIIEKHFTLDRRLPGPDHQASLEPEQLAALVRGIREVERALGSKEKRPAPSEIGTREVARRSLTAARAIRKGEPFTEENLVAKRPGDGISPMHFWEWLGRRATRDYAPDERIE